MIKSSDYNHKLYKIAKEGKSGNWELKKEIIESYSIVQRYNSDLGFYYEDVLVNSFPNVKLYHDIDRRLTMMASMPSDHEDCSMAVNKSRGKVLTSGLGTGLLPILIEDKLRSGLVTSLDIVENSPDVINLSGSVVNYLPSVRVIRRDIEDYLAETRERYDFIFIDIWASRAQAVAEGPGIVKLAERCLNQGGETRFWTQELWERLKGKVRGIPYEQWTDKLTRCSLCGTTQNHAHLYGCLCKECADEYEGFLPESELRSTEELGRQLISLGYKNVTKTLPGGGRPDLIVEGSDGKILVEAKLSLLDGATLYNLTEEILRRHDSFKEDYNYLQVVFYGNVKVSLLENLSKFISKHCEGWVRITYKGNLIP